MVSVTMVYSVPEKAPGSNQLGKTVMKKHWNSKFDCVKISQLDWVSFIHKWLRIYEVSDQYSLGIHSGPPFKMWWTGLR